MSKEQAQIEFRQAVAWRCPLCHHDNVTSCDRIELDRDQYRSLLDQQGLMIDDNELPEDWGLATAVDVIVTPDVVECSHCKASFLRPEREADDGTL